MTRGVPRSIRCGRRLHDAAASSTAEVPLALAGHLVYLRAVNQLESRVRRVTGSRKASRRERVQSLWGGYGEIVRMDLDTGPVIVKCVEPPGSRASTGGDPLHVSHQRKLRSYAVEMHWYRDLARRCTPVPRCPQALATEASDPRFLFVLEDLDAVGYRHRHASLDAPRIQACLRWLARFHATFLGVPPVGLWPVGTYWHLATRPDELRALRDPQLRRAAPELDRILESCVYKTLVHGDAKVTNFCFPDDPTQDVAAVDFQYVGGGCGIKDVAYFLSSIFDGQACDAHAEIHLEYYLSALTTALRDRMPTVHAEAVVAEWRALYPVAWADFLRFLKGWAPGCSEFDPYRDRMIAAALRHLGACATPRSRRIDF